MTTNVTVLGQFADNDEDAGMVNVYFDAEVRHAKNAPAYTILAKAVATMIAELTPLHPDNIHRLAKFSLIESSVVN